MSDRDPVESMTDEERVLWLWQTSLAYAACAIGMFNTIGGSGGARDYINERALTTPISVINALEKCIAHHRTAAG